jgi:hypothetical protein
MYLGDYLHKYLKSDKYRLSEGVLESFIVSPQKSLQLYFERANKLSFTKRLYYNPNIDGDFLDYIYTNPCVYVDFEKISILLPLDGSYVSLRPHMQWNYIFLAQNKFLPPKQVFRWLFGESPQQMLARRDNEKYEGYREFISAVFYNSSLNVYDLTEFVSEIKTSQCRNLLRSKLTTLQQFPILLRMMEDGHKNFFFKNISANPNLTLNYLYENISEDWDWYLLSCNPSFSVNDIFLSQKNVPGVQWKFSHLSMHPHLTIDIVLRNLSLPWDYRHLCINKNITIHDLERLPAFIFDNLFSNKYIFMNEYWDRELFEKYHAKYNFSETQIFQMFLIKRSWVRKALEKKKIQEKYYDELMAYTWQPSRVSDWIWDTDFVREWENMTI